MTLIVYEYSRCGTCRKAMKWFNEKNTIVTDGDKVTVGFKEATFEKMWEIYEQ